MAEICPGGREGKTLRERKDTRNWRPAQGLRAASEAWGSAGGSEVGALHVQEDMKPGRTLPVTQPSLPYWQLWNPRSSESPQVFGNWA